MTAMLVTMVTGQEVAFWIFAPLMVLCALGMVLTRKPVHSAMLLAAIMLGMAIQYAALDAPFLFAVQIIVYTGAILMLFLFVMMIVGIDTDDSFVEVLKGQRWAAAVAGIGIAALLIVAIVKTVFPRNVGMAAYTDGNSDMVREIAKVLFSKYVMHFELTSALLITAALGAMVLAHRERLRAKQTQAGLQAEKIRRFAETGEHPGAKSGSGVYALSNSAANPALLPDGTPDSGTVSPALAARAPQGDAQAMTAVHRKVHETISGDLDVAVDAGASKKELEK